ncbi:MAG TPA: asparagine synthase (glutamine-hydrolyzing), partial [Firmicutes bacterium]|nr:asparagine synthase (glutamine-hydrolyzing) [Bacillota bacterium]
MCGICGIYSFNAKDLRPKKDLLKRMTAALIHRGPDAEGYVIDKKVLLGMRRLSIIDLQTGSQPVYSEDKKVTAVFNGEIFNFRELREELRAKGHFFNSESDSEVIPHLYEEYRENFIDRLNGQFAIAVFDKRDNSILLIRDRLGIKPLYFYRDGENLIFGSELKAILPCLTRRPEIDPGSVWEYLSFACIPQDKSIYKNIRKLLPGFYLKADKSGLKTVQYWEIKGEGLKNITEDEVHHELLSLLKSSVKKRLISDVPLGVFLSGGIDSSAITALYREVSDDKLMTFSVGFREKSYNELEDAARIAEYFKTDHNFIVIDPDARETIDKLPALFDEPYADSSAVNVYHISRFSRERITVALSGEGGDEIFGGYMTYTADQIANIYRYFYKVLPTSHSILKKLVELLPSSEKKVSLDYKLKRFLKGVDALPEISHFKWKEIFDLEMKRGVLNQDYFTANLEQFNNSDPYTTISKYFNNYTGE